MKQIELLVKAEVARGRESLLFELLGRFGDKLPVEIQEEMREEAKLERSVLQKLNKKVVDALN